MSTGQAISLHPSLEWVIRYPTYLLLGIAALLAVLLELPLRAQLLPLAVSVIALGLPHGAIDHLAPTRAANKPTTARTMLVVGLVYLVLMAGYTAVWLLVPRVAFVGFILLTWVHWGQGDLYIVLASSDHVNSGLQRLLAVLTRGALPMVVPLIAFPETYREVARLLIGRFTEDAGAQLAGLFTLQSRLIAGFLVGGLIITHLVLGYQRRSSDSAWRRDAGETLGLAAFFSVVPPIFAIGVYFCIWHSLRHLVRLAEIDTRALDAIRAGAHVTAIRRVARDATPLTLGSLLVLGVLWWLAPIPPENPAEGIGLYLVFIAVLTLPHVAIVFWMDRVQGVWESAAEATA